MSKNAVQKLNEIGNDIKTVISLYEVSNRSKNKNDKSEATNKQNLKYISKIGTSKRLEATAGCDKLWDVPGQPPIPLLDSFKKTSAFPSPLSQEVNPRESVLVKKWMLKKPGSAPSSTSTLSTISESENVWQHRSDPCSALEKEVLSKVKTSDNLDNSNWLENSILPAHQAVMTPSKTLETANKILVQNKFYENESLPNESAVDAETKGRDCRSSGEQNTLDVQNRESKNSMSNHIRKPKSEAENKNDIIGKISSVPTRHEVPVEQEFELNIPFSYKSTTSSKINNSEKSQMKNYSMKNAIPKDELEMNRSVGTFKVQNNKKSTSKNAFRKSGKDDQSTEGNRRGKDDNLCSDSKFLEKNNSKEMQLSVVGEKPDKQKKTTAIKTEKKQEFSQVPAGPLPYNQIMQNGNYESQKDTEPWVNDLSKIIEKNNEKLEKMKVSKELALKIAKYFKEKYDEIQRSKEEFMEELKNVEKSNERLNAEVKEARECEKKLLLKIEGLKDDRGKVTEENVKNKHIKDQNLWLKAKLCETEKSYTAQLFQKDRKIEEIKLERLEETRNALKHQENLTKRIQLLTNEKSDLLTTFEELRRQFHESLSKTVSLEESICQLKEEVLKQKQHLKIKTETLQETNRELEMIRQNSVDLEEQVRTLRKNIDEFDGIQENLIKQTSEYQQEIKSNREKITELQNENLRLQRELENEKDGLLIKVKIIEDQQETIKQLKEKSDETKTLLRRNQSLERVLNIEREEKLELQEAVERLKWRKEELKKRVKNLENNFLLAPQEVVRDLQKTQIVLHELESQVQMKQKEWELQLQSIIKEKEQACSVAEFATKKLMETSNEFQKQSEAYKGLQRILVENFAVKGRHMTIREANKQVSVKVVSVKKKTGGIPKLQKISK